MLWYTIGLDQESSRRLKKTFPRPTVYTSYEIRRCNVRRHFWVGTCSQVTPRTGCCVPGVTCCGRRRSDHFTRPTVRAYQWQPSGRGGGTSPISADARLRRLRHYRHGGPTTVFTRTAGARHRDTRAGGVGREGEFVFSNGSPPKHRTYAGGEGGARIEKGYRRSGGRLCESRD